MRIGLVTHNVARGQGQARVNLEIARRCLARGHEVLLLADMVDKEVLDAGARWHRVVSAIRKPMLARVWEFGWRADRAIERYRQKLDLIVATGFSLRRPHDVNVCHFVHGAWEAVRQSCDGRSRSFFHRANQTLYTRCNIAWERQAYAHARVLVAVSQGTKEQLSALDLPGKVDLRVIPNGVDVDEFTTTRLARSTFGLPEGVGMAVFVGDIRTRRKNLELALQALRERPAIHLAVVGDIRSSPYPALARQLGVANRVHFLGYRRDVDQVLRCCDVLVFPSRYEPFGLVVLEAMACGLPVITTRQTGASDLVQPAFGVVLERSDDAAACAAALDAMIGPPSRWAARSAAARAAAERCTWQVMADQYVNLFEAEAGAQADRVRERIPR